MRSTLWRDQFRVENPYGKIEWKRKDGDEKEKGAGGSKTGEENMWTGQNVKREKKREIEKDKLRKTRRREKQVENKKGHPTAGRRTLGRVLSVPAHGPMIFHSPPRMNDLSRS